MLLQSTPDEIILLPALPAAWSSGKVSGLRTRTGMEVSMEWNDGKVVSATLTSPIASQATLNANGHTTPVSLSPGQSITLKF